MATATPIEFGPMIEPVARRLLGDPNKSLSTKTELRWGSKGSLSVDLQKGTWFDHEAKGDEGGGVLALIKRERRCGTADALAWLEAEGLKDPSPVLDRGHRQQSESVFYDYADADGVVAYRVERRGKGHVPPFLQHGPDGRGGYHAAKGCMQGVSRLPYRLPELLAADPDQIIFVVEGEKDADRLHSLGLIATTNSGGAGKFGVDLAAHFAGRRVVILPDNDQAGRDHAADVASKLANIASEAAVLPVHTSAEKSDVSDWLAAGGSAFELTQKAEEALRRADETFPIADLAEWAAKTPTAKAFVMAPFIPRDEVVVVTGDGGTNKSTLALQISACAAANKAMLGMDVVPGPALYITAEDDDRENHWRLVKIAQAIGTTLRELTGRLHVVSLRGRLNNELATFENDGKLRTAPAYKLLRATIAKTGAKLVTLDNVAHLFAGNENDRGQVTAFINLLYRLCGDLGVTILLIAHRNKSGDSYSGSTAWLNAVRSQIMLERHDEHDPDARRLSLGKANYARVGEMVDFRWHDFALLRDQDLSADRVAEIAATAEASRENDLFLTCLRERNRQGRPVSERFSRSYAPTVFAAMSESRGIGKGRLERAMDRLFRTGTIERAVLSRDKSKGRDIEGLREAAPGSPKPSPQTLPEPAREPTPKPAPHPHQTHPPTHPISKDITGAATRAAAPSPEDDDLIDGWDVQ